MNKKVPGIISGFVPLLLSASVTSALAAPVPGGTLDPLTIPKYVTPLVIPPVLYDDQGERMKVEVALRQISQQVLPTMGCPDSITCGPNGEFPVTPLWAYGNPDKPSTFNNPAFTFEVTQNEHTTVTWKNQLVKNAERCFRKKDDDDDDDDDRSRSRPNPNCNFLPHIITDAAGTDAAGNPIIDQTLHWAAPNQDCRDGIPRTDCAGASAEPYTGPIPMVTHLHGAHVGPISDGFPEAWWLPDANDIPAGYATEGTFYDDIKGGKPGTGSAKYRYTNDQPTSTLWYHDHSLGITRLNVYAAGAGFWLIRDRNDRESGLLRRDANGERQRLPRPAPRAGQEDPNGDSRASKRIRSRIREIPIAIQPKSFNADGSQYYPADRQFFEGLGDGQTFALNNDMVSNVTADGLFPFLPQPTSDIAPVWNPEAFFNTMVVNGSTWPQLDVASERYRFRLLNASDSRFMNLALFVVNPDTNQIDQTQEIPFYMIGSEQGLLPQVVRIQTGEAVALPGDGREPVAAPDQQDMTALLVGPAERFDVIVDFTELPDGTLIRMVNTAPDAPFGGFPDVPADPGTTGQVMQFMVDTGLNRDRGDLSTPPADLRLDANPGGVAKLGAPSVTQDLALLEEESHLLCVEVHAVTGVVTHVAGTPPDCPGLSAPFGPMAAVLGVNGSTGLEGSTAQLWDDPISTNPALKTIEEWELWNHSADAHPIHLHLVKFEVVNREVIGGAVRPPEPWETGWKDTVIAYPGEVTRVKALFDKAGLYVWHCHILSHEDNEMMVPFCVGDTVADGNPETGYACAVEGGWPVVAPEPPTL